MNAPWLVPLIVGVVIGAVVTYSVLVSYLHRPWKDRY